MPYITNAEYKLLLTTIGINKLGFHKANFEIMEDSRFMKVTEGCEVIFTNKYVWISQRRKSVGINRVFQFLSRTNKHWSGFAALERTLTRTTRGWLLPSFRTKSLLGDNVHFYHGMFLSCKETHYIALGFLSNCTNSRLKFMQLKHLCIYIVF